MSALSDYLEEELLDEIFNNLDFAPPVTYVALFTDDPTDAGTGTEVTGGSYAREVVNPNGGASPTWDLAVVDGVGKLVDNTHDIVFTQATAPWGDVTHMGIFDALTDGNLLYHGALDTLKPVGTGDTFKFVAGNLNLRME